jgi:hypothetical protein
MTMTSFGRTWHCVVGCLLLSLSLAALGCGGSKIKTATVNGKVTYKEQLVKGGSMAFALATDASVGTTALINEDGTYTAERVPVGEVKVTVETDSLKPAPGPPAPPKGVPMPKGGGTASDGEPKIKDLPQGSPYGKPRQGPAPANYVRIPAIYNSPDKTPLKYKIEEGTQTINIELKDLK